jgi:hypothetical protein
MLQTRLESNVGCGEGCIKATRRAELNIIPSYLHTVSHFCYDVFLSYLRVSPAIALSDATPCTESSLEIRRKRPARAKAPPGLCHHCPTPALMKN